MKYYIPFETWFSSRIERENMIMILTESKNFTLPQLFSTLQAVREDDLALLLLAFMTAGWL
jgi:hypothetical protein